MTISQPGSFTLGANSRDLLYGQELGVAHQASEGAGISTAMIEVRDDASYDKQVDLTKNKYGKSSAWQSWMKSNDIRTRYEPAWHRSRAVPTTIKISFRYGGAPLVYDPPWEGEFHHMQVLDELATN